MGSWAEKLILRITVRRQSLWLTPEIGDGLARSTGNDNERRTYLESRINKTMAYWYERQMSEREGIKNIIK